MAANLVNSTGRIPAERSVAPKNRVLAVDYGRKRVGLALSDEMRLTARPLLVLNRTNRASDLRRLREVCREYDVGRIVVGHPLHITGEAGEMAQEAARFAQRLRRELGIDVELLDERLTSWEAGEAMKSSPRRKSAAKDDVAAAVLLREYLDRSHAGPSSADGARKRD